MNNNTRADKARNTRIHNIVVSFSGHDDTLNKIHNLIIKNESSSQRFKNAENYIFNCSEKTLHNLLKCVMERSREQFSDKLKYAENHVNLSQLDTLNKSIQNFEFCVRDLK